MIPPRLTFIDVETTGYSPVNARVIEIGILRVEDGHLTKTFKSLVSPGVYIPPEITLLTGIHPSELDSAPTFYALKDTIRELLEDSIFVAHNAKFDYSFIQEEFLRIGETFTSKILCTARLSRRLFPSFRHHNLDSIIERFGITCESRHRAFDDAKVLWEFIQKIDTAESTGAVDDVITNLISGPALPPLLSKDDIDRLPNSCGVYLLYDVEGTCLYIGKSVHIKDRVLAHFSAVGRDSKEAHIFPLVASIETKETNGELGALLLEASLIKKHKPLYNRHLREVKSYICLFQTQTPDGYNSIRIEERTAIYPSDLSTLLAIYKSKRELKTALNELASTYKLCKKLLGIEKTDHACFGSELGTCRGACEGKELPIRYNMRFVEGFYKTKIKKWPYPGPIAIVENDTAHVISSWCYAGEQSRSDEAHAIETDSLQFDYDLYHILTRFLLGKNQNIHIKHVPSTSEVVESYL